MIVHFLGLLQSEIRFNLTISSKENIFSEIFTATWNQNRVSDITVFNWIFRDYVHSKYLLWNLFPFFVLLFLKICPYAEACLGLFETSVMELFVKIS